MSIGTLQERIGVLVVGGSPQLHSGLREVASQVKEIRWMESAYHLEEALERVVSRPPQVLLLELRLPGIREYEMARRLRQTSMPPAIIALTPTIDDNYLYLAISLGAAACLPLDTPPEFLVSTIRRVHQGEQPIQYTLLNNMHVASQVLQRLQELPPLPSTGQAPSSPPVQEGAGDNQSHSPGLLQQGDSPPVEHPGADGEEPCLLGAQEAGCQ